VGAIIANIPMVDKIDIKQIRTGDIVEVNAYDGVVKVLKRKER
jgi:predicted aconitase with swiveling domain